MLVPHIAGLERIGADIDREHGLDDVAHRNIGHVRPMPAAPAEMQPDAVGREAAYRMVQRLDLRAAYLR